MGVVIVIIVIVMLISFFSSGSSTPKSTYTPPVPRASARSPIDGSITPSIVMANAPLVSGRSVESKVEQAILGGQDVKIRYRKYDGTASERRLSTITYNNDFEGDGYHNDHIKGYCHLRQENRTFKIDRIVAIEVLS